VSAQANPARADVCIIGGGASGATAAKVLTESGARVAMLERGPWRQPKQFSPDELANVNRYFLTPDPRLHPRTHRSSEGERAEVTRFSPTPFIVGGGTSHWTGWVPRMFEVDFEMRSRHGDVPGADLAGWPISYADLEPYYDKVEWSLGVSGRAGANVHEAPRSRPYPLAPLPRTRYAKRFQQGCDALGINSFPMPIAMRSAPFGGRPKTLQSAFVQTMGDPSGTRGGAAQTFVPDAVATGRLDLRPRCSVRELEVDAAGRICAAVYEDAGGALFEQEADVFVVACNAIESARLLLLSRSTLFPDGLANHNGLVGRFLTVHEYTEAIGVFEASEEPLYPWAGGGYISAGTADYYATDESRGFIAGGLIAAGSAGFPLPVNWALPDKPAWGPEAKRIDREYFNRSMSAGIVLQDLPQATNRVDLDPEVRDAWGVPVARITHEAHANDLAQANWLVDRCGEILEAAGASKVWRNHIGEITGNAVHQHGTLRMGDDPETSVVDAGCRAHSVPNLYVVDGSVLPTPSGVNPTLTIMANAWRVAEQLVRARGRVAEAAVDKS
jgi:choline dehydrogenase-like flavoprotein